MYNRLVSNSYVTKDDLSLLTILPRMVLQALCLLGMGSIHSTTTSAHRQPPSIISHTVEGQVCPDDLGTEAKGQLVRLTQHMCTYTPYTYTQTQAWGDQNCLTETEESKTGNGRSPQNITEQMGW